MASSCERGAGLPVPSTYELVHADGAALPALLARDSACVTQLHGATLEFRRKNSYASTYRIGRVCTHGRVDSVPDPGTLGRYNVRGDSILFLNAAGRPTGAGVAAADSLVIAGPEHVLTFRRSTKD